MDAFNSEQFSDLVDPAFSFPFDNFFSTVIQPASEAILASEQGPSNAPSARPSRPIPSQVSSAESHSPPSSRSRTIHNDSRKRVGSKIALAPGQPPTARGNDRIRVYVACQECRARKRRCDGARPVCDRCQKHPPASGVCSYGAAPNRKGRDRRPLEPSRKVPGTTAVKRRRTDLACPGQTSSGDADKSSSLSGAELGSSLRSSVAVGDSTANVDTDLHVEEEFDLEADDGWEYDPFSFDPFDPQSLLSISFPNMSPEDEQQDEEPIPARPSIQFARDTWWDALLAFYVSEHGIAPDTNPHTFALTSDQRNRATRIIMSDVRAVLQSCGSWMCHMHLPKFFATVLDPVRRKELQPSLLLGVLALGILAQSSEVEQGARGRDRALKLLEMAHGALQSSLATGWVDVGLAQASWMILYYELNSHPLQSWERSRSAMLLLDSLVRLFSLTRLDAEDQHRVGNVNSSGLGGMNYHDVSTHSSASAMVGHAQQATAHPHSLQSQASYSAPYGGPERSFSQPNSRIFGQPVPHPLFTDAANPNQSNLKSIVGSPIPPTYAGPSTPPYVHPSREPRGCFCAQLSLQAHWPSACAFAPLWSTTLMWPTGLSEADLRKEECRRLVWSSVAMIANFEVYACLTPHGIAETGKTFVREFEQFALQTPSEALLRAGTPVPADDVWSLSLRAVLLLHACLRVRENTALSGAERAEFATRAWLEIDDIERRLERHTCSMASHYAFHSTEMLFSLRICVSHEFQRYIPYVTTTGSTLFYREKTNAWLRYQAGASESLWDSVYASASGDGKLHHRKSLCIYYFMSGIKKCLVLWDADPTLTLALTNACQAAEHLEYLLIFWPVPRLRQIWQDIRYQLVQACLKSGLPPPPPAIPQPIPRDGVPSACAP